MYRPTIRDRLYQNVPYKIPAFQIYPNKILNTGVTMDLVKIEVLKNIKSYK